MSRSFRKERIMLVVIPPIALVLLIAIGIFLYTTEKERNQPQELLTADKVFPTEVAAEPTQQERVLKLRELLREAEGAGVLGEVDKQRAILQEMVKDPLSPQRAVLMLAQLEWDAGHADEALNILQTAQAERPNAAFAFGSGVFYMHQGRIQDAIAAFAKATELNPGRPVFENARLLAMLSGGQEQAVADALATRRQFNLEALRDTWVMADAALRAREGQWVLAAEALRQARRMLHPESFNILLQFPALKELKERPELVLNYEGELENFSFRPEDDKPSVWE